MIVEVGTSDFRTEAGKVDGLFIEPVKYYFDRLPECRKLNVAVSDYVGTNTMYFLSDEQIKEYNLPDWVRGCNSFGSIHPTVSKLMCENGIKNCSTQDVDVFPLVTLLERENIQHIDLLKIDTEGHDCIILNHFIKNWKYDMVKKIQFENNVLSNPDEVYKLVGFLLEIGYKCRQVKFDMICEL